MLEFLTRLKPTTNTAADLRARLAETEATRVSLAQKVASMTAQRGAMLVDGSASDAASFLAELRETEDTVAALQDVAAVLQMRLKAAEKAELAESLAREGERLARESAALTEAMAKDYVEAAGIIGQILAKERDFCQRLMAWEQRKQEAESGPDGVALRELPPMTFPRRRLIPSGGVGHTQLGDEVALPSVTGEKPNFWPPLGIWQ